MLLLLRRRRWYELKVLATARASLLAFWPLFEVSGTVANDLSGNARNGTYAGVTLGQAGIGDGNTAPMFPGTAAGTVDVLGGSLVAAFNGLEGSLSAWCKVAGAGTWSDATLRRVISLQTDPSNRILLQKATAANTFSWQYIAGGVTKTVNKASLSTVGWFHIGITWSKSGDALRLYFNGIQEGATITGLGTHTNGALGLALIGGSSATGALWAGSLAHVAVWGQPLSDADIARLAVV